MNDLTCPVCESCEHQSFWHWDKEDSLMREWAMDTKVHFSICRNCGTIFQNPPQTANASSESLNTMWSMALDETPIADEPMDWLQQFSKQSQEPAKALEIYFDKKRFEPYLTPKGWEVKSIPVHLLLKKDEAISNEQRPELESGFQVDDEIPSIVEGEEFDIAFCFDALEYTNQPIQLITKIHQHVKEGGYLYAQVNNPHALPRFNQSCLTSKEHLQFPFRTLIYMLFKCGFVNEGAEMCTKTRCICAKGDLNLTAQPSELVPADTWGQTQYRFTRNYYWNWTIQYMDNFIKQIQTNPDHLHVVRNQLAQSPLERHIIRDVCGACLLFVQEVDTLQNTITHDWAQTMSRIFKIFKYDYAMYDLLKKGGLESVKTLPEIERFYMNDKMVYLTDIDYFEKYFTMDEARVLCDDIIKAGQVVCGHLSSML